jgi:hypothetical protein
MSTIYTSHPRYPEDGDSSFHRNVGKNLPVYTTSHPRTPEDGGSRLFRNVGKYLRYTHHHIPDALKLEAADFSETLVAISQRRFPEY